MSYRQNMSLVLRGPETIQRNVSGLAIRDDELTQFVNNDTTDHKRP